MGFDAGDGVNYYSVPGSQTSAMLDIETTSNINVIGKYMFSVSAVNITAPGKIQSNVVREQSQKAGQFLKHIFMYNCTPNSILSLDMIPFGDEL